MQTFVDDLIFDLLSEARLKLYFIFVDTAVTDYHEWREMTLMGMEASLGLNPWFGRRKSCAGS
jgi:hypothetical protein